MPKVTLICEWCDEEFRVYPCRVDTARFCSNTCSAKHKGNAREPEGEPRECDWCGESYYRPPSAIGRFCSSECFGQWFSSQHDPPTEKTCTQCGYTGPAEEFNSSWCGDCNREYLRNYYQRRKAQEVEVPKEKHCPVCNEIKPASRFHAKVDSPDGLYYICADCANRRKRLKYALSEEFRNYVYRSSRRYRDENPEKVTEWWRARKARMTEEEREEERRRHRLLSRRRRAAEGSHTHQDVERIWHNQNGQCIYCRASLGGSPNDTDRYHVDHIIPLADDGTDNPENLQCLCPECNWRKADKDPNAFAQEMGCLVSPKPGESV